MTVLTDYSPLLYSGNGATQLFEVTWPFFSGSLVVTRLVSDVETELTINVDYTVTGGTDGEGKPGLGSVIFGTAPASGTQIRIERDTPLTQGSTWDESDNFPQAVVEAGFDKSILIAQEIAGKDWSGPKGDKGDEGPANTLSIGTVTKGDDADASITGAAPSQILNLVLPKGDQGEPGFKPVQVDELSDRDAYDDEDEGFSILVSDVGDGRAAIYSKNSNASADWSDPAYVTGEQGSSGASAAEDVSYDNAASGLPDNVQGAIDELAARPAIPPGYDQLLTSVAYQAMLLADVTNFAVFPAQDRFADSFDDLTYVDVANALGLDSSTQGVLRPGVTSGTTVTINTSEGTYSQGGSLTFVDRTTALVPGAVISKIGVFSTPAVTATIKIVVRNFAGNYTVTLSQSVSHAGGGWQDFDVSYTVPGSGTYYLGLHTAPGEQRTYSATGMSRAAFDGDATGTVTMVEETGRTYPMRYTHSVSVLTMSVATTALPLVGEPDVMHGLLLLREVDSITPNTDVIYKFSRDDGANWLPATLTMIRSVPIAGGITLKLYTTDYVDVSGQTYVAPRAQLLTPTGKMVEWRAHHAYGML